jgi:hypothetical protein
MGSSSMLNGVPCIFKKEVPSYSIIRHMIFLMLINRRRTSGASHCIFSIALIYIGYD